LANAVIRWSRAWSSGAEGCKQATFLSTWTGWKAGWFWFMNKNSHLNSWWMSSHIVRYDTNPPAIQKQHRHSREAQIEPPLFECECAFRIQT
jgi:hypothetical protein